MVICALCCYYAVSAPKRLEHPCTGPLPQHPTTLADKWRVTVRQRVLRQGRHPEGDQRVSEPIAWPPPEWQLGPIGSAMTPWLERARYARKQRFTKPFSLQANLEPEALDLSGVPTLDFCAKPQVLSTSTDADLSRLAGPGPWLQAQERRRARARLAAAGYYDLSAEDAATLVVKVLSGWDPFDEGSSDGNDDDDAGDAEEEDNVEGVTS